MRSKSHWTGESTAAAEDFTLALCSQADDAEALAGRGWAYVALEANALAERDFERAVQLKPGDADALLGRAYVRVKAGSSTDGLRDAEAALRFGPRQPDLLYNAARVFARAARRYESDPARQSPTAQAFDCSSPVLKIQSLSPSAAPTKPSTEIDIFIISFRITKYL